MSRQTIEVDRKEMNPNSSSPSSQSRSPTIPSSPTSISNISRRPPSRPNRLRSRTSSIMYPIPMPPVMSRENSSDSLHGNHEFHEEGQGHVSHTHRQIGLTNSNIGANFPESTMTNTSTPTSLSQDQNLLSHSLEERRFVPPSPRNMLLSPTNAFSTSNNNNNNKGRKASKSVSSQTRPPIAGLSTSASTRTYSYNTSDTPSTLASSPSLAPISPVIEKRIGLKRRISTPNLPPTDVVFNDGLPQSSSTSSSKGKGKAVESRARATSTSIVTPQNLDLDLSSSTLPGQDANAEGHDLLSAPMHLGVSSFRSPIRVPPLDLDSVRYNRFPPYEYLGAETRPLASSTSLLTSVYNTTESALSSLISFVRPSHDGLQSRRESTDSEKGFSDDEIDSAESSGPTRNSVDSTTAPVYEARHGRVGRFWGLEQEGDDYFSRPPSPDGERPHLTFENHDLIPGYNPSLPTPALSYHSLSRPSKHRFSGYFSRTKTHPNSTRSSEAGREGWIAALAGIWAGYGTSKTADVIREMGWTVGVLVVMFVVSFGLVVAAIGSLPVTTLKHLPTSTTDLQLLSAEIRSYMVTSNTGWWHTILVVTYVGCWKHAWSVPGAVVLNILVGSLVEPIPALALLTYITATGSLGAYLLSRPLAPLIGVLFPKPLSLVRAALAPDSVPPPNGNGTATGGSMEMETVTAIELNPGQERLGGSEAKPQVWRRLLIMRAGGFVPWSGMNVACGVVGVDWRVFWLTTAAGSASWSYVTASVGNILSRLAIPSASSVEEGESLSSLLRDPSLIFKLVFLSVLTLLPVLMKRKSPKPSSSSNPSSDKIDLTSTQNPNNRIITHLRESGVESPLSPSSPMSPLSTSLSRFTPTPAPFDLLSFGRTAVRQSGKAAMSGARGAVNGFERVVAGLKS